MNKKEIIIYVVMGVLILSLLILTFFPGIIQAWRDSGKSVDERCQTPPGYTDEEWREHMGHHPNIYKECLE